MSASLIKCDGPLAVEAISIFALQHDDGLAASMIANKRVTITDPETEAARIIADAHEQAAQIEREAMMKMESTIRTEVDAQIARVIDPWREQLQQSLEELTTLRSETFRQAESELVTLAIEIARKVIHREVATDSQIVSGLARVALSRIPKRAPATIHLHPDDLTYLESNLDKLQSGHSLTLVVDHSIGRGGCVVHTELGDVDATIEQQFAEIEEALLHN
jgi:flagellar assembly protein FliH